VTGATHGIGREIASTLAGCKAHVVIHGRNSVLTEQVLSEIQAASGNQNLSLLLADFGDLEQVRRMADNFLSKYERLDVLVNNAGTFYLSRQMTPYGVEKTLLVNHLAPFLLTQLLLGALEGSGEARIINVSSGSHHSAHLDLDNLSLKPIYNPMIAYANSKLANILFTYELDRRLESSPIMVNAVHPGRVATNIWRTGWKSLDTLLQYVMQRTSLSVEEGADTPLYMACSDELDGISGQYFDLRQAVQSSPRSYDRDLAHRLWEFSSKVTGLD
jgi:NAD(P)-dependent dehydrogenase (short-subunit alcohol dehydrogenase family)